MITEREQYLYNTWLAVSRSSQNKPFKLRKNFDDLDSEKIVALKRISLLLDQCPHISPKDFFTAPYIIYSNDTHFDLSFYYTIKATKAYNLYAKKLELESADSEFNLNAAVRSLKFIKKFCEEQNISINNYINHDSGLVPSFFLHLKDHKVSIYCLLGFENFESRIKSIDKDVLFLGLGENILNNIQLQKVKFLQSEKCKLLVRTGLKRLGLTETAE